MSNILQDAIKAAAPKLASYLNAEIEANKAAIETRLSAAATTIVEKVASTIVSGLPQTGIAATLLKPEVTAAVNKLAAEVVGSIGGEVAAAIAFGEAEITNLGAQLAAMV